MIEILRIPVFTAGIVYAIMAMKITVTRSEVDMQEAVRELFYHLFFMGLGVAFALYVMTGIQNIGSKWAQDLSGAVFMLIGGRLWYDFSKWRRSVLTGEE